MHKYNTLYTRTLSWHVLPQHLANVILKIMVYFNGARHYKEQNAQKTRIDRTIKSDGASWR